MAENARRESYVATRGYRERCFHGSHTHTHIERGFCFCLPFFVSCLPANYGVGTTRRSWGIVFLPNVAFSTIQDSAKLQ